MTKNQKGFSVLEAVLIVLVLAALGGAGFYVYHNKKSDSTTNNAPLNTTTKQADDYIAPSGYTIYEAGDSGFKFAYPKDWKKDNQDNPTRSFSVVVEQLDKFEIGGGLGVLLGYKESGSSGYWVVKEQGRFPVDEKVGDEFDLPTLDNPNNIDVFKYQSGDGPFSQTDLLFRAGDNIVRISLPAVCYSDECSDPETSYSSQEIDEIASKIATTVKLQ